MITLALAMAMTMTMVMALAMDMLAAMGVAMVIMALMSSFRAKCEIDVCRYSGDSYDMGDCFACGDCCAVAEDPPPKNVEMPHRVDDYD